MLAEKLIKERRVKADSPGLKMTAFAFAYLQKKPAASLVIVICHNVGGSRGFAFPKAGGRSIIAIHSASAIQQAKTKQQYDRVALKHVA